jgi:hypothetical protein
MGSAARFHKEVKLGLELTRFWRVRDVNFEIMLVEFQNLHKRSRIFTAHASPNGAEEPSVSLPLHVNAKRYGTYARLLIPATD